MAKIADYLTAELTPEFGPPIYRANTQDMPFGGMFGGFGSVLLRFSENPRREVEVFSNCLVITTHEAGTASDPILLFCETDNRAEDRKYVPRWFRDSAFIPGYKVSPYEGGKP
jgi:hypothetical protein